MVALAETSAPPARKTTHKSNAPLPVALRLRIRNLYVVQGLSPAQIAPKLKLDVKTIYNLATRERWTEKRAEKQGELEQTALAREKEQLDEVIARIGDVSEDAAMAGLNRAVECTTKKSKFAAKDYASWANGARALVSIARQARGLEDKSIGSGASNTINLFVGRFGPAVSASDAAPKNVTPAQPALEAACTPVATPAQSQQGA